MHMQHHGRWNPRHQESTNGNRKGNVTGELKMRVHIGVAFPRWRELLKENDSWKAEFIKNERKKLLNYKSQLVKSLQPVIYCPFAGYFVEAHPSDRYIKETNVKNSAENLNALINKLAPDIKTWTPKPGAVLDLGLALRDPTNRQSPALYCSAERHLDCVVYLSVIETDDNFEPLADGYDYLVDFLDLSFPTKRPDREHSYLEIKNRVGVLRYVVLHGLLWDDLYIGFQNRISRDPDIYHHKFWNHFQTELPVRRPDWDQFLQQETSIQEPDTQQEEPKKWSFCVVL